MGFVVEEVTSRGAMRQFIRLPLALYEGDPFYVPHLLMERREFFSPRHPRFAFTQAAYFLARDSGGRPVGRVSAHVNERYNDFWAENTGFFGFYECTDDPAAAAALMGAAEGWLRARGMMKVRGPFSFSTNEECGLLAMGFDRAPAIMMPYTRPWYLDHLAGLGYAKAKDLLAYEYAWQGAMPGYVQRLRDRMRQRSGAVVRPIRMGDFEAEVRRAFSVYNRAWERNWGFVPMTDAQFVEMARQMKPIVDPRVVLLAEIDEEPVGFLLGLPDYTAAFRRARGRLLPFGFWHLLRARRRAKSFRALTMGVVEEHRRRGIEMLLVAAAFTEGIRAGYRHAEFSWILEENALMTRVLERFGAEHIKTYRIFEKTL